MRTVLQHRTCTATISHRNRLSNLASRCQRCDLLWIQSRCVIELAPYWSVTTLAHCRRVCVLFEQPVNFLADPLPTSLLPVDDDDLAPSGTTTPSESKQRYSATMTPVVVGWQHEVQAPLQQLRDSVDSP